MPAPSRWVITRVNPVARSLPARRPTSAGLTPEASSRTRTSPGPATGVGMSPKVSTSGAAPVRSYQTAFISEHFHSQRARECAAIKQDVLARDKARLGAAEKRASLAEFLGVAEAAGRIEFGALGQQLVHGDAALVRVDLRDRAAQAVGVEGAGQ